MNGQEGRARRKVERLDTQKKDSSYCPVFFLTVLTVFICIIAFGMIIREEHTTYFLVLFSRSRQSFRFV